MISILKRLETPYEFSRTVRIKMFSICMVLFVTCMVIQKTYRPYIYANGINDFHVADSFTDFFAVPVNILFFLPITGRSKYSINVIVIVSTIALILYEFIGLTFDYYDMLAAVISGILTAIVMRKIFPDWR